MTRSYTVSFSATEGDGVCNEFQAKYWAILQFTTKLDVLSQFHFEDGAAELFIPKVLLGKDYHFTMFG
jgi:hypothetical protein